MANLQKKNMDSPDDTRTFSKGRMQIANMQGTTIGRFVFEPGWKWSESVKPIVKTESCQQLHTGYLVSGHMRVRMDDGLEAEQGLAMPL